mmetsp:Transcript_44653/g.49832  ORF Transcript_44653/g.49832 Transcript_44653/m.49832 type:complete len:250 (+) Transcript_44653:88-837(+)
MPNDSSAENTDSVDSENPVTVKNSAFSISEDVAKSLTPKTTTTYENYLALTERALQKSRKSLDTRALIKLAYGNDTAHIGGSGMLIGILDGILEKIVKETVLQEMERYGTLSPKQQQQKREQADDILMQMTPKKRLDKIDRAVLDVIEWEANREQIEGLDIKSARDSLNKNLLSEGVSTEDIITYREHEQRLIARTALQQELQKIEEEMSVLKDARTKKQDRFRQQLGQMASVEKELESSANVCAMITT